MNQTTLNVPHSNASVAKSSDKDDVIDTEQTKGVTSLTSISLPLSIRWFGA